MRQPHITPEMTPANANGNGNGHYALHDEWAHARTLSTKYYRGGSAELDKIAIGDREAKDAMLLAPPTGNATMLAGPPAGGKSMLGRHGTRVIGGVDAEHTAFVPPMMDMTQQQFAGGEVRTKRKIGNNQYEEEVVIIEGIVKPTTRKIFGDETPRQNPYVQNSSLSAIEEGVLLTSQGEVPLDDLVAYIGTMNAADTRQGSIKPSDAFAARHGIGVLVGKTMSPEEKKAALSMIAKGQWKADPESMNEVIDLSDLKLIRKLINDPDAIGIDDDEADHLSDLAIKAENYLEDYTGEEAWRLHKHALKNAKALTAFAGKTMVGEVQIERGIKFALLGRVVILATGKPADIKAETEEAVKTVIGKLI